MFKSIKIVIVALSLFGIACLPCCEGIKDESTEAKKQPSEVSLSGDAQRGEALFDSKCTFCHYADRTDSKLGPGLKDVLKGEKLPVSGRPAIPENVTQQLMGPYKNMPSFSSLSEQEIKDLVAYLQTL